MDSMISTTCLGVTSLLVVLATSAVGLRLWARRANRSSLAADDYVIIAALVFCYGLLIISAVTASLGGVNSIKGDPMTTAVLFVKVLFCEPFLLTPALVLVKVSILLFYQKIFFIRSFRIACNIMIGIVSLWGLTSIILQLNMARPLSGVWDLTQNKIQYNYSAAQLFMVAFSIALDLATLSFPLPVISKLHMKRKQKYMTMGIFWLGAFCVVAAAVRFYYGVKELNLSIEATGNVRYAVVRQVYLWDRIEPCASVIAACLPTYAPLVKGNRTLASIFRSAASFFSVGSGSRSGRSKKISESDQPSNDLSPRRHKEWMKMGDDTPSTTTVAKSGRYDLESQKSRTVQTNEIEVSTGFNLEYTER